MISDAQAFWSYVISKWLPKCEMWVRGIIISHMSTKILMLTVKLPCKPKKDIESYKVTNVWKTDGLVHPPTIRRCLSH